MVRGDRSEPEAGAGYLGDGFRENAPKAFRLSWLARDSEYPRSAEASTTQKAQTNTTPRFLLSHPARSSPSPGIQERDSRTVERHSQRKILIQLVPPRATTGLDCPGETVQGIPMFCFFHRD